MVCSNCKSKDIVTIQGQYFCLNCGRPVVPGENGPISPLKPDSSALRATVAKQLPAVDAMSQALSVEPEPRESSPADDQTSTAVAVKLRTRDMATPAAPPQETPTEDTLTKDAELPVETSVITGPGAPAIRIIKKPSGQRLSRSTNSLTVAGASGQSAKPAARLPKSSTPVRRISDLKPGISSKVVITAQPATPVDRLTPDAAVASEVPENTRQMAKTATASMARMHFSDAVTTALGAIGVAKGKRYGYVAALLSALPLSFFARWLIGLDPVSKPTLSTGYVWSLCHNLTTGIPGFSKNAILYLGAAAFYVIILGITKLWAAGALSYGYSKEIDHRPLPRNLWSAAGWNSLWSVFGNASFGGLQMLGAIVLATVADQQFAIVLGSTTIAFLAVRVIVWIFAAIMFNRALGQTMLSHYAIVLGGLGARSARKQSAKLWVSTSGATLSALLINITVVSVFAIVGLLAVGLGVWLLQGLGSAVLHGWAIFGLSLASWVIVIHASLVFSVVLWLGVYRWAIGKSKLTSATNLLSGRQPMQSKYAAASGLVLIGGIFILILTYASYTHSDPLDRWYRQNIQSLSYAPEYTLPNATSLTLA